MLILQNLTYRHPNKDLLFGNISLTLGRHEKAALVGNNGSGKSTLLKIIAGLLQPSEGWVKTDAPPYYAPQVFGQFNDLTIAQALRIEEKLTALKQILEGAVTEANLALLNDDWTIEERCREALAHWKLADLHLTRQMAALSGGQKTKVFLAGIAIHQPSVVLLDEPSNHLDAAGRDLLYEFVQAHTGTLMVVSHDRTLLNLLPAVYELEKKELKLYGGNYAFYQKQKELESNALNEDIKNRETALRKAKERERETAERQQKLDARGKKKQEKSGLPTISMNTFRNNAEKSTSRLKSVHAEKVDTIAQDLNELRRELPGADKMKFGFDNSALHRGKVLITAKGINFSYGNTFLWNEDLHFQITSGERIALKGANGSGKTTLIKLLLGAIEPSRGSLHRAEHTAVFIDQDYSLINNSLSVYGQVQQFNFLALQEHELKIRLTRFLFTKDDWDKPCSALSGGEKMRLLLCCLTVGNRAPDLIVLDEPTNNLDIRNSDILTGAVNEYEGTLVVVSHDRYFLEQINVKHTIVLA